MNPPRGTSSQQTPAAPRRLFLPKRVTPSQTQTPATVDGPRFQFQSTPRLGQPAASRPSQQAGRRSGVEDVEEDEDVVEESSLEEDGEDEEEKREDGGEGDRIEVYSRSSSMGDSQQAAVEGEAVNEPDMMGLEREDESMFSDSRAVKRRRISISPLPSHGSPGAHQEGGALQDTYEELDVEGGGEEEEEEEGGGGQQEQQEEGWGEGEGQEDEENSASPHSSCASELDDAGSPSKDRTLQQPTFRAPPRFKALDQDGFDTAEGLPLAFSPQRRGGPKYIAGGLASELQGWLSAVKGWGGGADGWPGPRLRVVLEDVKPGRRMYLTRYIVAPPAADEGEGRQEGPGHGGRLVLAGEGTLTGLGQRADVRAGSVVEVNHPVWDIKMDGCVWIVACDWSVQ